MPSTETIVTALAIWLAVSAVAGLLIGRGLKIVMGGDDFEQ